MTLWIEWFRCIRYLRPACARTRTFLWLVLALLGLSVRADLAGVTSVIRAGFLLPAAYRHLLHLFHTPAVDLEVLTAIWVKLAGTLFAPLRYRDYLLLTADGLKVAKEGRKMPGVKSLHQESANNTKPEYIMGHSFQAVGLLVKGPCSKVFSVPLASRIHEGVVLSNRDTRTLLDKLIALVMPVAGHLSGKVILLVDAYYASQKVIEPLMAQGHEMVTRVRSTAVAYEPPGPSAVRGRGRPARYGSKVRLADCWRGGEEFISAASPAYGERGVTIRYRCLDLLWRPVGRLVRFVFVDHPSRGRLILMTTLLTLDPIEVIRLYALRFKIEVSFKPALHTIGAYAYHFWMRDMTPIRRGSGNQYLHRKTDLYRSHVQRKLGAYHLHVQLGCIAQGLLINLAVNFRVGVWSRFHSWLRTMDPGRAPSERVSAQALRATLPEFLLATPGMLVLEKFIATNVDFGRLACLQGAN
jgi:hypothetical protein